MEAAKEKSRASMTRDTVFRMFGWKIASMMIVLGLLGVYALLLHFFP